MSYVIGLDYGTDSVRALIVDTVDGAELSSAVFYYPRWKAGKYCDPSAYQFRQHPLDYLEGLENVITLVLSQVPKTVAEQIVGISVDTTGSTPVAVDKNGTPLALLPEFSENPNGMFILWKDHTANLEAEAITTLAHHWEIDFTKYVGGIYSAEWFWAKIWHTIRVDERVRNAAFSWMEHCDWISAVLTGDTNPLTIKRSRCAAGHKAMWHEEFEGLPSDTFFTTLDPLLSGLRKHLYRHTYTSEVPMDTISKDWAQRLGLPETVVIGVGTFDAHAGAVGAGIEPYTLVRVMGTSTCDMLIAPNEVVKGLLIKGICGQVDGSILPGMMGMEAGQSAFGDVYAWFQNLLAFPLYAFLPAEEAEKLSWQIIPVLSEKAAELPVTEQDALALDWFNGRRTPDANHHLKGAITGLNLGSDAPEIFKALVEATAFGAKRIVQRFQIEGVPIQQVVGIGGVSKKSPFVMQTLANVLNMPIKIVQSEQSCALGAAIYAATAAGVYPSVLSAQHAMASAYDAEFQPQVDKVEAYKKLFQRYEILGASIEQQTI